MDGIPPSQRSALIQWLFEDNLSYAAAKEKLLADFGLKCSMGALSGFYKRTGQQRLLETVCARAKKANAVVEAFEQNPHDSYSAVMSLIGQLAMDKASSEELDVDSLFNLTKLLVEGKKVEQKSEDLSLQREKFQRETCALFLKWSEDQRAKTISTAATSNTDKIEQLGALMFGPDWK